MQQDDLKIKRYRVRYGFKEENYVPHFNNAYIVGASSPKQATEKVKDIMANMFPKPAYKWKLEDPELLDTPDDLE